MANDLIDWQARAEAAEQKLREIAQFTLRTHTRAEAAEAEVERLRDEVQRCNHELAQAEQARRGDYFNMAKSRVESACSQLSMLDGFME